MQFVLKLLDVELTCLAWSEVLQGPHVSQLSNKVDRGREQFTATECLGDSFDGLHPDLLQNVTPHRDGRRFIATPVGLDVDQLAICPARAV